MTSEATAGGRAKKKKVHGTPSRASARLKEPRPSEAGITSTRTSPRVAPMNTADPVVLKDLRNQPRRFVYHRWQIMFDGHGKLC